MSGDEVPDDVHDLRLWWAAQAVLRRHWPAAGPGPHPGAPRRCAQCLRAWPCPPYRLARDAEDLARHRRYLGWHPADDAGRHPAGAAGDTGRHTLGDVGGLRWDPIGDVPGRRTRRIAGGRTTLDAGKVPR